MSFQIIIVYLTGVFRKYVSSELLMYVPFPKSIVTNCIIPQQLTFLNCPLVYERVDTIHILDPKFALLKGILLNPLSSLSRMIFSIYLICLY